MASEGKITVSAAVISHIGNVRPNNEDNFFFDGIFMDQEKADEGYRAQMNRTGLFHLFGICDGMGGLESGERASYIGASGMQKLYRPIEEGALNSLVRDYAMRATDLVLADSAKNGANQKEGTTMVLLYLRGQRGYVANIGDSRVYLLRGKQLTQISEDHSQVYRMMLQGKLTREQMRKHPRANAITHYIGMPREKINEHYIHYETVDLANNDRFLICSDGLSDLLSLEKTEEILVSCSDPLEAAEKLTLEALELSGKDNTTVIVADISGRCLPANGSGELPGMEQTENSPTAD